MKYNRFIIEKYRGIIEPVEIKIKQGKPIALVGLNESGKSTILEAIFAFDNQNDTLNSKYKQLDDIKNLYVRAGNRSDAIISAIIDFEGHEFDVISAIFNTMHLFKDVVTESLEGTSVEDLKEESDIKKAELIKMFISSQIKITRTISDLTNHSYSIELNEELLSQENFNIDIFNAKQNEIAKKLLEHLPTMVYVTEFDTFMEEITLNPTAEQKAKEKEYRDLYNNLFLAATNNEIGLDAFAKLTDAREYSPYLEDVTKYINQEFTKRWEKFSIEHNFSKISINLLQEQGGKLKIVVYEEIDGRKNSFNISNRSSGFRWYFNFIMRTMFNPIHKNSNNNSTLYLMDEPGTFLHESSQKSLALELKDIMGNNFLIYSTHHFQMLNLTNISLNNIYIVEKHDKLVRAYKTTDYQGYDNALKKAVISPILHSLRFTFLDMLRDEKNSNKKFLIVEGLHDFYFLHVFVLDKKFKDLIVWPSVGASQIVSNVPEFKFYHKGVYALVDNDEVGVNALEQYIKATGDEEFVFVLPFKGYKENKEDAFTMNNMFTPKQLVNIYTKIKDNNIEVFDNYKSIMEALFEHKELLKQIDLGAEFEEKVKTLKELINDIYKK